MLLKYLDAFYKNLNPDGMTEIASPVVQFILDIINSKIFRILYFIPISIIQIFRIVIEWYYNNFMNNEAMLQSPANRVVFVYLIPIAAIISIIRLLSARHGQGFYILLYTPLIFLMFPLVFVWAFCELTTRLLTMGKPVVERKRRRLMRKLVKQNKAEPLDKETKMMLGDTLLHYGLDNTPGYKKILMNLVIPDEKSPNGCTRVKAVRIDKSGVSVWNVKTFDEPYYYGGRYDKKWYRSTNEFASNALPEPNNLKNADEGTSSFPNPLWSNRKRVNLVQKILKENGFSDVYMLSGIAFLNFDEVKSRVEFSAGEKICHINMVPGTIIFWNETYKKKLRIKDIKNIYNLLLQYKENPDTIKPEHIENPKTDIDVHAEPVITVNFNLKLGHLLV